MMGIYKITNMINNKCYIGLSTDIYNRWRYHKNHSKYRKKSINKPLYKAFKKYGIDNFKFEILEECEESKLSSLEIYYIEKFKSNDRKYGYNLTKGGDSGPTLKGSDNPNSVCSEESIVFLRNCYNNKVYKLDAYKQFQLIYGELNFNTFNSIWAGKSYKYILPEVYTKENKKYHRTLSLKNRPINFGPLDTKKYVMDIRIDKKSGMSWSDAYKKYSFININTFNNIWVGRTFKSIIPS